MLYVDTVQAKYHGGVKAKEVYVYTPKKRKKIFGESAMSEFRSGGEIKHKTLDTLCRLLDCKIEDVIEYIPDTPTDKP